MAAMASKIFHSSIDQLCQIMAKVKQCPVSIADSTLDMPLGFWRETVERSKAIRRFILPHPDDDWLCPRSDSVQNSLDEKRYEVVEEPPSAREVMEYVALYTWNEDQKLANDTVCDEMIGNSPPPTAEIVPFELFKLPPELRLTILEFALNDNIPIEIETLFPLDCGAHGNSRYETYMGLDHPILRVSTRLQREAAGIWFSNQFYFHGCWYFANSIDRLAPNLGELIQDITINWTADGAANAILQLAQVPNLRILRLKIDLFLKENIPYNLVSYRGIKELKNLSGLMLSLKRILVVYIMEEDRLNYTQQQQLVKLQSFLDT